MKIKYMLVNKTGKARKIPPFEAWQWTHHIDDESHLKTFLNGLKKSIRDNRLTLANLHVEPAAALDALCNSSLPFYKGPIIYDESLWPTRIINRHEDDIDDFSDDCDEPFSVASHTPISFKRQGFPWGFPLKS